ncbi:bifunctional folylpolyglutamate synthase/dihydrofolate synthase [Oculatella sp. LEGE 06141]|uniref:bifunctional folylpolyglutamate synthase/dihydrofolate synthase n=1 Tax=Oculatella sp. LEGE 06141 TaxID=1828648 RepID=UPI0018808200|nr:folylpolyglutamate synthase/dihydrofolate synthase family protein [Oculatella sp. LEGE 06141]MBE9182186.1 bifunctional folylpolyglutamate synthase/dihydrofolate synthase [Oculatella sp. LEGE 06141]
MNSFDSETIQGADHDSGSLDDVDTLLNLFAHFGVELGLERIQRLLARLNSPHQQVPVIHVAGSNGKGSVCAYLSSVLTTAGYRVGRYTSPHLVNWCERICVNEQPIAPTTLYRLLQQVQAAIQPDQPSPTQFEVITAAAWLFFAQQQVDVAVMEVGLGGRLDATNVCDRPLVSIITSLSREHWQRLGPTLADIAFEKAGILKPNCAAIVAPQPPDARAVIERRIAELNCPTLWVTPSREVESGWAIYDRPFADGSGSPHSLRYRLPLPGAHQLINSAVAIAALQSLQQQGWTMSDQAICDGIAKTQWRGRLQWFTWRQQTLLIDGAHNPAAAAVLRQFVDRTDAVTKPVNWVMGMLTTKDHADVFKQLLRDGDRLYLVPVPDHLSADLNQLAAVAQAVCPGLQSCQIYADVVAGLEGAIETGAKIEPAPTTILCGSLYLIGYFFKRTEATSTEAR